MDYSRLLNRAWTIVWGHKFLILLGVVAALSSVGGGNNSRWEMNDGNGGAGPGFDFGEGTWSGLPLVLVAAMIMLLFVLFVLVWVLSTVARGGLIAAVDTIEEGGSTSFRTAWVAGWQRVWPLLGIALVPALPILLLLIGGLVTVGAMTGFAALAGLDTGFSFLSGAGVTFLALACLAAPFALALALLHNFAERACMLEHLGVFASYRRGWEVLAQNLGPAIILFLIQLVLSIVIGIGMIGPGIVMVLCFLLWPILLLISGTIAAYFSSLWTLAWREWTVGSTHGSLTTHMAGV